MPERFIFRQVYFGDTATFLKDCEIRAKNHTAGQVCHQTSYQGIVDRRGTDTFEMPCGGVVNDYVPFYFSPITSFSFTIHKGNVPLISPNGENLGKACDDERIFLVGRVSQLISAGLDICFSDFPLNSRAPMPKVVTDIKHLEDHVHWDVFDEYPRKGAIPEIGYVGVHKFFHNMSNPQSWQTRSQKRMAEFLVRDALPLNFIDCIVAKSDAMRDKLQMTMDASNWNIPIYAKRGCYF